MRPLATLDSHTQVCCDALKETCSWLDPTMSILDPDEDSDDLFDVQQCSRTGNIFVSRLSPRHRVPRQTFEAEEEARVEQEVQRRLKCGLELHERLSRGPMNIKEICEATDCRQKEIEGVLNECQPFFVKSDCRRAFLRTKVVFRRVTSHRQPRTFSRRDERCAPRRLAPTSIR